MRREREREREREGKIGESGGRERERGEKRGREERGRERGREREERGILRGKKGKIKRMMKRRFHTSLFLFCSLIASSAFILNIRLSFNFLAYISCIGFSLSWMFFCSISC